MYVPSVDRPLDDAEWRAFVVDQGFGHVICAVADGGWPVAIPAQYVLDGDEVLCHVAASNPLVAAIAASGRAMLSVAGDWAFVPSSWKAIGDEDRTRGLPTTYYAVVQLRGAAEVVAEPGALAELLRRQLGALQPDVEIQDPEDAHHAKLAAIRGVVLHVEEVASKFKFGGNVDEAHRRAVADRLESRGGPGDVAAAAHARRRIEGPPGPSAFTR